MFEVIFFFKMVHLSPVSGGLFDAIPVSSVVHVHHCGLYLSEAAQILRISDSKHRIVVSEAELASPFARVDAKKRQTIGYALISINPYAYAHLLACVTQDNLFYILSANPRLISP